MSASIKMEISAGTAIDQACAAAHRTAFILGVNVEFEFNGVRCLAMPDGSARLLAERQQAEQARKLEGPFDHKFVTSRFDRNPPAAPSAPCAQSSPAEPSRDEGAVAGGRGE